MTDSIEKKNLHEDDNLRVYNHQSFHQARAKTAENLRFLVVKGGGITIFYELKISADLSNR